VNFKMISKRLKLLVGDTDTLNATSLSSAFAKSPTSSSLHDLSTTLPPLAFVAKRRETQAAIALSMMSRFAERFWRDVSGSGHKQRLRG
jgi:hypothetical protein